MLAPVLQYLDTNPPDPHIARSKFSLVYPVDMHVNGGITTKRVQGGGPSGTHAYSMGQHVNGLTYW